ncbi:MAG: hypothetical protein ACYSU6_08800 [Planctomycetota bacterium]
MLKKHIARIVNRYGWWRLIHIVLTSAIITLAGVLLLELAGGQVPFDLMLMCLMPTTV